MTTEIHDYVRVIRVLLLTYGKQRITACLFGIILTNYIEGKLGIIQIFLTWKIEENEVGERSL